MQEQKQAEDVINPAQVDAAVAFIKHALGWEMSADDEAAVRSGVERQLRQAARMRAYPLKNSDEPDFAFQAYRAEG